MGIYYDPSLPAIVPDGFLSIGVERFVGENGRLSYVFWEEDNIPPILAIEIVSKTYGGEYERKKEIYADLGIPYYAVYLPNQQSRRKRQSLEVYALVEGRYQLLEETPVWLPEIVLSLGRGRGTYLGREREWLYWFDNTGNRLPTPEERVEQAQAQAEEERLRADRLAKKLEELRVDPKKI